ncbi:MAG: CaiB/BaiF CoA-transferase family protein [Bacteroidota bacterium]
MNKPLAGITILDFTRLLPGPMATHLLAQLGAKVIKIESPKRPDYVRMNGTQVEGTSILFHLLNHNKEVHSIDYNSEEGLSKIKELVQSADVFVEQFRPGAMEAWGLGYEHIKAIKSDIVYASITGYGQEGPFAHEAGHDINYLAYSGLLGLMKDDRGKPNVADTQWADIGGAYHAVMQIQAALLQKEKQGKGCYLDISLTDAMKPFLMIPFALHQGGLDYRLFNIINGKTTVNYAVYPTKDGKWLAVGALEIKFWNNLCEVLEKPEWKKNHQMELLSVSFPKEEVEKIFTSKDRDEWMKLFQGKDVCVAPVLEIEELDESAFHLSRASFQSINIGDLQGISF